MARAKRFVLAISDACWLLDQFEYGFCCVVWWSEGSGLELRYL